MHSHYPLQSPHASHCTRLHHLSTTSSPGHAAPPAGPETRGTGPDRDDSAVGPRLDRAAIERAPAVSRGDPAPLAADVAAAGRGRHHGATQGTAAGRGPAPRGHNCPAAIVAGTTRMVFRGMGCRAGHALSDPAQCPVDPPVLAGNGRYLSAHQGQPAAQTGPGRRDPSPVGVGGTQKKARDGEVQLLYLDESGYALTPPMTYTWALPGTRPLVQHESHRGQRVHVLAALAASGTTPQEPLCWQTAARTWKSEDVKAFLQDHLPGTAGPPRVVVLDNASIHRYGAMHTAPTELAAQQITLKFLPAYTPELNLIEHTFRRSKHTGLAARTYTDAAALTQAVDQTLQDIKAHLISKL